MRLNTRQIAAYTEGAVVVPAADEGAIVCGVTWDSREVTPACLFVALPGQRVDGHSFVPLAIEQGAAAVLVMADLPQDVLSLAGRRGMAVIRVADTHRAFANLARGWRNHLTGRVIGLTGSVGKTTTKNMVRDVLSAQFSVVATKANQNNELGVPRTLLNAQEGTQVIVVEMGMRGLGEIASLCELVRPDWGLITIVGDSHIELLGSRDAIAQAKCELFDALPEGGRAFLDAQGDYAAFLEEGARLAQRGIAVHRYALAPESPDGLRVWAGDVEIDACGCPGFTLNARMEDGMVQSAPCRLSLKGMHNVLNACAAASVALAAGMDIRAVAGALASCQPEQGRQALCNGANGCTIIDDSYNANPQSMCAALRTLAAMQAKGRRIAVLGDMGELGAHAPQGHRLAGALAGELGIDLLVCVGQLSRDIACSAVGAGLPQGAIVRKADAQEALAFLRQAAEPEDLILVKASHYMGLHAIVEGLMVSC